MTHHQLSKSRSHTWSWSRRFLLSFMSLQIPTNCLWCIRYRSWDYCWFRFAEVKICNDIPTASTYLNSATLHPNPKPPPKLLTKIRTNPLLVHTSGANHKPPSKLLTKIRTTQCTHQYVANQKPRSKLLTNIRRTQCTHRYACRSTYHWILLLLLLHSSTRTHAQCNHAYCCKWVRRGSSSYSFWGNTSSCSLEMN